ncbi:MAG: Cysteine synthase [uncultured Thermomicrobiales bacterium]|uniref:cysteine synthase n=1 Tax=uncultured Thermomicrobiales bacterium TaxID=1645740 RepID=A0A6J4UZT9_9BACT|nr:MAG: Cysteine synthase [uncultured Thermomicrobiales bacterium]
MSAGFAGPQLAVNQRVIELIGGTPVVELRSIVPPGHARVLVKLESHNPTGSMKDRAALAMVQRAADDGRLPPGGTVVECTSGSTGTSLAMVAVALGYRCLLVTSDAFSDEKLAHMRALGAELALIGSDDKQITESLVKALIETSRQLSEQPGHYWADQFHNPDGMAGYHALGEELARQVGGRLDAFVHSVGTAQSLHGTTEALRRHQPDVRVVAVEPAESPVYSAGRSGAHKIEGIGMGFVVPLWRPELVDEVLTVSTDEAKAMARQLAREEGLFGGASSGANVAAALRVAARLGPDATVATLLVDSGIKYLSTDVYHPA